MHLLCFGALCTILIAGLWPFHAPRNGVAWSKERNGLSFGPFGTVISSGQVSLANPEHPGCYSLEIWLEPATEAGSSTILAIYAARDARGFSLQQLNRDLAIETAVSAGQRRARVYADEVFKKGRAVFLTVASGSRGTTVYRDGLPIRRLPGFPADRSAPQGRLVIGTSPLEEDAWSGKLGGLALYRAELSPQRIFEHYRTWTRSDPPLLTEADRPAALYLFKERAGNVVHNDIGSGRNLYIPERFRLLHEKRLVPPWNEYHPGLPYWKDVALNIAGFVPLGFVFCAYWALSHSVTRAAVGAMLLGVAVTLTIEILQSYLPTRQSGQTDLLTNTLGTCLGVALYRWPPAQKAFLRILNRFCDAANSSIASGL